MSKYINTLELQEISLVNFMAAKGYDPIYDFEHLRGFHCSKFRAIGVERISVLSAIRMHNEEAEEQFAMLKFTPYEEFQSFISNDDNVMQLNSIFAGTIKIFKRVKLSYGRKQGLILQSDNVEFMTKRDAAHYESFILAE
jgi:hypothetical protein